MTRASEQGREAQHRGGHRHDNPYDVDSNEWADWMDGFDQATVEAERRAERAPAGA